MYTINTTARYIRMGKPYTSLQVYTERSRQLVCLERYGFHLKTGFRESRKFTSVQDFSWEIHWTSIQEFESEFLIDKNPSF